MKTKVQFSAADIEEMGAEIRQAESQEEVVRIICRRIVQEFTRQLTRHITKELSAQLTNQHKRENGLQHIQRRRNEKAENRPKGPLVRIHRSNGALRKLRKPRKRG